MTPELWLVSAGIPTAINAFFVCRFLCRTLGAKYRISVTFAVMFLFDCIYGALNSIFHVAGSIPANALYFCVGFFVLYTFLFHGRPLKRLYFTILAWGGYGIIYHIFLPLNYLYAFTTETSSLFSTALLNIIMPLFQGAILEYIGRKFQNLRHDLPTGYTIYLMLMTALIYTATFVTAEYALMVSPDTLLGTVYCASFSALGMTVIVWGVISVDRHMTLRLSEQRYSLQTAHFKSKEQDFRQLTRLRHDMKNHLLCVDSLLREGKIEQASTYLESLTKLTADADRHISTGNDFADAILNEKYAEALSSDIAFTADAALPVDSRLDPVDLGCILSNTLDNAIRASGQSVKKWIELRAFSRQSQLILEVKNSVHELVKIQNGRVFPLPHGIGLESVRNSVEKYNGVMEIASDERCFTFSAMLPLE